LPAHDFKCHVCRRPWAPFGVTCPGPKAGHPEAVRGKRFRFCALGSECEAQAIARMIRACGGVAFPFRPDQDRLRARVEAILAEPGRRPVDPFLAGPLFRHPSTSVGE
jgi:hypothetical protein